MKKQRISDDVMNEVIKSILFIAAFFVLIVIGFFVLNGSLSLIKDFVFLPIFIYVPLALLLLVSISMIICKFKCKLELIPKIAFITFVILVIYYVFSFPFTSSKYVRTSKTLNTVKETTKIENIFPQQVANVNFEKTSNYEFAFFPFGKLSYEAAFRFEDNATDISKNQNSIMQDVVCFENTPLLNEDKLIENLKARFFDKSLYFGSNIEKEDIISGEINGVKYQYVFKQIYEKTAYNYEYCFSLLLYNENAVLEICNICYLNDALELDPLTKIQQITDLTKDVFNN